VSAGKVDWIIFDAKKVLNGASDYIGKAANGNTIRYLKVVIDHIDNGKIVPKTAFPVSF